MAYVPSPTLFSFVYLCFVPEPAGVGAILATGDDRQGTRGEPMSTDERFYLARNF
jgi:hypothetical protein